jgi:GNAT superfamily N-acetyltransferase
LQTALVDEFGEEAAYGIGLSPERTATASTQTWDPLPSHEAPAARRLTRRTESGVPGLGEQLVTDWWCGDLLWQPGESCRDSSGQLPSPLRLGTCNAVVFPLVPFEDLVAWPEEHELLEPILEQLIESNGPRLSSLEDPLRRGDRVTWVDELEIHPAIRGHGVGWAFLRTLLQRFASVGVKLATRRAGLPSLMGERAQHPCDVPAAANALTMPISVRLVGAPDEGTQCGLPRRHGPRHSRCR